MRVAIPAFLLGGILGAGVWEYVQSVRAAERGGSSLTRGASSETSEVDDRDSDTPRVHISTADRLALARLCAREVREALTQRPEGPVGSEAPPDADGTEFDQLLGLVAEAQDQGRWSRASGVRARTLVSKLSAAEREDFSQRLQRAFIDGTIRPQRGAWSP